MSKKTNGSHRPDGAGADKDKDEGEGAVLHFPTLAERDRQRKERLRAEEKQQRSWRAAFKKQRRADEPPFLNFSKIPPFTRFAAAAFILVHLVVFLALSAEDRVAAFYFMGFVPGYFTGAFEEIPWFAFLGPFSHMFIHGGWMHLAFNTVMVLALGTLFERRYGPRAAAFIFFACGLAGAGVYMALSPFSSVPVIGASGGISGLFGAAILLLHSQGRMGPIGRRGPWPLVLFWVGFMILSGLLLGGANLAWQAHIGGFLAGIGLFHLIRTGRIRL